MFFTAVADLPHLGNGGGSIFDGNNKLRWTEADFTRLTDSPARPHLASLSIPEVERTPEVLTILTRFPRLESITFRAAKADDRWFKRLATEMPGLVKLNLKRCRFQR